MATNPQIDEYEAPKSRWNCRAPYDEDQADEICLRLVMGQSLTSICKDSHLPNIQTVYHWRRENPVFAERYARAREDQADTNADEINDVRGKVASGELDPAAGRVIIDALKWEAGKRKAKVYGDSTMLKHANADGETIRSAIDPTLLSPDERDTLRQLILASQQRALSPPEEAEYEEISDVEEE
jgi:hypothetical protein